MKNEFDSIPSYIYDDIENWSMNDFVNVRNGTFVTKINTIIQKGEEHVFNCEVKHFFSPNFYSKKICTHYLVFHVMKEFPFILPFFFVYLL